MWHSDGRGTTIRITAPLSPKFQGDRRDGSKNSRQSRQKFPLQLPLVELQDRVTKIFGELRGKCEEEDPTSCPWNDWILKETWRLIANWAMLCRSGRLCQRGGRCLHRQIGASLCGDRIGHTVRVNLDIRAKLVGSNVQEAFHHLKGWYRATTEKVESVLPHNGAPDFRMG